MYINHYLPELPFDEIDKILENWITYQGNNANKKDTGKYYERFDGNKQQPPVPETECTERNHIICTYYINSIKGKVYDYLQLIADLIEDRDVVYALTIVDIVLGIAEKANSQLPKSVSIKALSDGISALKKLRHWLEYDNSLVQNVPLNTLLDDKRYHIVKPLVHKIDGSKALAREIGFDNFIKYAIEQCYFFQPDIVYHRRDELTSVFGNTASKEVMPARKTERGVTSTIYCHDQPSGPNTQWFFVSGTFRWPINRDKDGNDATRTRIKKYTGYSVAEGKDSIFQNYIISHIWGNAFDPRYFTNLWNIVLVPAWANNLLDKDNADEDSLEFILKDTIMKIIISLYGISSKDKNWNKHFSTLGIPMPTKKSTTNKKEITISIINNHDYHMSEASPRALGINKKNRVGYIIKDAVYI